MEDLKLQLWLAKDGMFTEVCKHDDHTKWDISFLRSVRHQLDMKGSLSEKQWTMVAKIRDKVLAPPKPKETIQVNEISKVLEFLNRVPNFSSIRVAMSVPIAGGSSGNADWFLKMYVATDKSKFEGQLQLLVSCDPDFQYGKEYLGRVDLNGLFFPHFRYSNVQLDFEKQAIKDEAVKTLNAIALDPEKVVREFGQLTGQCSFCKRRLSDDISKAYGYGKHCAKKYQLTYPTKKQFEMQGGVA